MKVELVTTLKRQATKILADLHSSKEPVLITEHGQPSAYLIDVDDIADYIALHNVKAVKALVQKIFRKVERLEEIPESGKIPIEIKSLNFREVFVPPCNIFYKNRR